MAAPEKKRLVERDGNRVLLIFVDVAIFAVCLFAVLILHPSDTLQMSAKQIALHVFLSAFCVFGMRFLFRVYRQIWRYGNMRAFTRLLAADILGGVAYVGISHVAAHFGNTFGSVIFLRAVTLISVDLIVVLVTRGVYYYAYYYATLDTPSSRAVRKILRVAALVDFDSREPGALLKVVLEPAKRSNDPINEMQRITRGFAIRGDVQSITQINKGYINRTYRVETLSDTGHVHTYTLQRINTNVFPDVDALMQNFILVTDHLRGKLTLSGDREECAVSAVRMTKDGRSYLRDDSGCWRMTTCFNNVYSLDIPDSPACFYHAGQAFGKFILEMSDVETHRVKTVIPNFHNTWSRYCDLEKAIEADPVGRVKDVAEEIEFVRSHKGRYRMIAEKLESGAIPTRICHNDCNLNNILFDNDTHLPVAIIDLDTVMPSSPLYDYGDSMRIGTNTAVDDEKDLTKVSCDLMLYEQYARGWLESCGKMLTKEELELLPYASLVITAEDGIRFLMDYINGDIYYNIFYPGQNLDRARTQLALLRDMEEKLPQIKEILRSIYEEYGIAPEDAKDSVA